MDKLDEFKNKFRSDFEWKKLIDCPVGLNLYFLRGGDYKHQATQISCGQDIAGDSVFSLGMIAEIKSSMGNSDPWQYRRLFWESGMIGHSLYLSAEFIGLRGTGIGCYFDDPVRELLGVKDSSIESLYHFAIGGPVDDYRLQTHAPYIWAEKISLGKFEWGDQSSSKQTLEENTKNSILVPWNDKWVSKIGMGLRGMNRNCNLNMKALKAVLNSPLNVFETSPDETDGEDELLLGETISKLSQRKSIKRDSFFIITRGGWVCGRNSKIIEELVKRANLQIKIHSLHSKIKLCLSPEFLNDQIDRSLYRIGTNYLDLFLLRTPFFIDKNIFAEICEALRFLEDQCKTGRIKNFGLSIFELKDQETSFVGFPLERLHNELIDLNSFKAVEIAGNFVNKHAFVNASSPSFVARAKKLNLKVLVGSPLKGKIGDNIIWLADYFSKESWEENIKKLLSSAKKLEMSIHQIPLADNRILEEAFRDVGIRSPFNFYQTLSSVLEKRNLRSMIIRLCEKG